MSYETIMEVVASDYFRQMMLDGLVFIAVALTIVCICLCVINDEQKRKINELKNMVDYYYNEESLRIK